MIEHRKYSGGASIYVLEKRGEEYDLIQRYYAIGSKMFQGVGIDNRQCLTREEAIHGATLIESGLFEKD